MALTKVTGQGLETLSDGVTITVDDNSDTLTIKSTDTDANEGPILKLLRDGNSAADDDVVGVIKFNAARDDSNADISYGKILMYLRDASDGSEDAAFQIIHRKGGSDVIALEIKDDECVFNNGSNDVDFRVETDGNTHAFFVEGSTDNISMGGSDTTPGAGTDARLNIITKNGGQSALVCFNAGTGAVNQISMENGNGQVGRITTNGTATSYQTSSDYRLKENVDYTWDATARLKQLKPARFNFISDDTNTLVDGFLAHEVSSVVPEAISGTKDEVDGNDKAVMQGIDPAKLVPLLVKTIQELEARLTAGGL